MANVLVEKQSLVNAADAIREKLGSEELIAPENFATEIGKISGDTPGPTPPTPDPVSDYGVLRLYDYQVGYVYSYECYDLMNPYSVWLDRTLFSSFCETNNIDLPLDTTGMGMGIMVNWGSSGNNISMDYYPSEGEPFQKQWTARADFESETGIHFVGNYWMSMSTMIMKGAVINPAGPTTDVVIASQNDLNALCSESYYPGPEMSHGERILTINGNLVPSGAVKAFYFGTQDVVPNGPNFLAGCKNMVTVSTIPQRFSGTESLFAGCSAIKRLDFDEGSYTFNGASLTDMASLEEIHVGDTTTISSLNGNGQYYSNIAPICSTDLFNVAMQGYTRPKTIRVYGGNRAAIISAWGESYYEQQASGGLYRFLEDGGQ